jgi:endoglucanase Acf2
MMCVFQVFGLVVVAAASNNMSIITPAQPTSLPMKVTKKTINMLACVASYELVQYFRSKSSEKPMALYTFPSKSREKPMAQNKIYSIYIVGRSTRPRPATYRRTYEPD